MVEKFSRQFTLVGMLCPLLLLAACTVTPSAPSTTQTVADVQRAIAVKGLRDDRGSFRALYCAVLQARGDSLPDHRDCDSALRQVGSEPAAGAQVPALDKARSNLLFLLVPGLGWECFADWLDIANSAPEHVANFGYEVRTLSVDGLSSTEHNARQIREAIAALPAEDAGRPLVLMGYSKGAPDILAAMTAYPEVAARVAAVIAIAGAVGGSPLAEDASQDQANLLTHVPGSVCDEGDRGAVDSLKSSVRRPWLSDHPLPATARYYSIVTYPQYDNISRVLRGSYKKLAAQDARNDSQVIIFDQMIPGSTLAAFVDADHWAMAVPVARSHAFVGSTLVDHNAYPREGFLEALLRYVEADLADNPVAGAVSGTVGADR